MISTIILLFAILTGIAIFGIFLIAFQELNAVDEPRDTPPAVEESRIS